MTDSTSAISSGRRPRALVTGLGVIAPNGVGADAYWAATLAGKSGVERITAFDPGAYSTTLAGVVDAFVSSDYVPGRFIVQTDRWTQLGLAATAMALSDAGADPEALPEYAVGVVTASSS